MKMQKGVWTERKEDDKNIFQCEFITLISKNFYLRHFSLSPIYFGQVRYKNEARESDGGASVSKCCQTSHATDIPKL